jgi:7,8-dihydro-6-hydroxymethylpterin-pyrophosphokinase
VRLERWAARTLDIDIITFGSELIETKSLIIPHPRAHERAFVLVPWAELDSDAVLPGHGKVFDLAAKLANQVWKFE